jgi:hypothetical protein
VESLPRNILADTGPIFALIHAGDADHERAVQFARRFTGRLITTWPVLTEVSYLLVQSDRRSLAVLFGMILDGHLSIADLDSDDVQYMRTLTAKYDTNALAARLHESLPGLRKQKSGSDPAPDFHCSGHATPTLPGPTVSDGPLLPSRESRRASQAICPSA